MVKKKTRTKRIQPENVVISSQTFGDAGGDLERPRLKLGGFIKNVSGDSLDRAKWLLEVKALDRGVHTYLQFS